MTPHLATRYATEVRPLSRFLTVHEVTRILGISRPSLYAWMSSGHFPRGTKIGPRRVGWLESDVETWIQTRRTA